MDSQFNKKEWWRNLDLTWKRIFKLSIDINHNPTDEDLDKILALESIDCSKSYILSLEPLERLPQLRKLNCSNTKIRTLDKIKDLILIDELNCSSTDISSLESIRDFEKLWFLDCSSTKIQTLKGLENLNQLNFLKCSNTGIKNLEPLINLGNLRQVDCDNTSLEELRLGDTPNSFEITYQNTPLRKMLESNQTGMLDISERDELFEEAARLIVAHQQGSTTLIQRKLKLGYNRSGRIIDQLEAAGIIGPFEGSKAREVLIQDELELERLLNSLRDGKGLYKSDNPDSQLQSEKSDSRKAQENVHLATKRSFFSRLLKSIFN